MSNVVMISTMGDESMSGMLMLVCVATGREISTGAVYTNEDLARTRRAKLRLHCPYCGEAHLFHFADARLGASSPTVPSARNG